MNNRKAVLNFISDEGWEIPSCVMIKCMEYATRILKEVTEIPGRIWMYQDWWDSIQDNDIEQTYYDINVFFDKSAPDDDAPWLFQITVYKTRMDDEGYITCDGDVYCTFFEQLVDLDDMPLHESNPNDNMK